jgi:hypothetical protein
VVVNFVVNVGVVGRNVTTVTGKVAFIVGEKPLPDYSLSQQYNNFFFVLRAH